MLFGLGLGLFVAFIVYLRGAAAPEAAGTAPRTVLAPEDPAAQPAEAPDEPEAAAESRFDFYELLPRFEVVIPEIESRARPDAVAEPVARPGRYVLQAGSFTRLADADRMQASLALLGVESRIQRVTIDDAVFHRVRVGPIEDLGDLNEIRRRLRDARIETLLMQVPE